MMSFNTVGQENPLGPRAPLSWQDVQTQAEKYQAAIHHPVTAADERWCTDMEKVSGLRKPNTSAKGLLVQG